MLSMAVATCSIRTMESLTVWAPCSAVLLARVAAPAASLVLRETSCTVACISFMAVASWFSSCC
ncbi:hypothetical protein D3C76_1815940 [compost metagenome]